MIRDWSVLAEQSNNVYTVNHFKDAAYQLVAAQVLYETDPRQRIAYGIVASHRAAYVDLLQMLGMRVEFNDDYRYCCAIPQGDKQTPLALMDTLFVLVLRKLWHERALAADLDDGVAGVTIEELQESFRAATGRELLDQSGELRERVNRAKRFGIARVRPNDDESGPKFSIDILPGIADVVSEGTLAKLALHQQAANARAQAGVALQSEEPTEEQQ